MKQVIAPVVVATIVVLSGQFISNAVAIPDCNCRKISGNETPCYDPEGYTPCPWNGDCSEFDDCGYARIFGYISQEVPASPNIYKQCTATGATTEDYCVYQNFNCKRDFVCLWDQVDDFCYQGSYCGNWLVKSEAVSASCKKISKCPGY